MRANEIDRALREDREIAPSPGFVSRVMGAVRRHVHEQEAIAFPWGRLLSGLAACALVAGAGVFVMPPPTVPRAIVRVIEDPAVVQAATWIPMVLLGTWLLAWLPVRLSGDSR